MDNDLVWDSSVKHEVFRLIDHSLPEATNETKSRLLSVIVAGRPTTTERDVDETLEAYLIFNYLVWIEASAGAFPEASQALRAIRERHSDFEAREHPDLDSWVSSSGFIGPQWPCSPDKMQERSSEEAADYLQSQKPDAVESFNSNWLDTLGLVAEVTRCDPAWGLALAEELRKRAWWDSEILGVGDQWMPGCRISRSRCGHN